MRHPIPRITSTTKSSSTGSTAPSTASSTAPCMTGGAPSTTGGASSTTEVLCPAPEALLLSEAVVRSHTVRSVYTFMNCFYTCYAWSICRSRAGDQVCVVLRARSLIMKLGDGLPLKFTYILFFLGLLEFFFFVFLP